jgi:hypothetical protein
MLVRFEELFFQVYRRWSLWLLALLLMTGFRAVAFINVEAVRRDAGPGFAGKSSLKFSAEKGATNKLASNASTLNIYNFHADEIMFLADYNYSTTNGAKDTNNARFHLRYTIYPKAPLSYELFTQYEFDQFRDLQAREIAGGNLRQALVEQDQQRLYAGYGAFYEIEVLTDAPTRNGLRGNIYLSYVYGKDPVQWTATVYYQPAFTSVRDYRIQAQANVETKMTARLSLEVQVAYIFENYPPPDVPPSDVTVMVGFNLKY